MVDRFETSCQRPAFLSSDWRSKSRRATQSRCSKIIHSSRLSTIVDHQPLTQGHDPLPHEPMSLPVSLTPADPTVCCISAYAKEHRSPSLRSCKSYRCLNSKGEDLHRLQMIFCQEHQHHWNISLDLFSVCARDTFIPEEKLLRDPRRLYAPGRMFHIVERKPCSCGRMPPEVRTAIPVEGRFEHIVLSCNAVYDHSLVWIEREAQKALERMEGGYEAMIPPTQPIIARDQSHDREHKDALEKAAQLTKEHHDLDGESYMPLDYDRNEMNFESELKSDQGDAVEKLLNDDKADGLGR